MNVRELINALSEYAPDTPVVVEYDTHFNDVKSVQPQLILLDRPSWGDYACENPVDQRGKLAPTAPDHEQRQQSSQRTVVAIWGTQP